MSTSQTEHPKFRVVSYLPNPFAGDQVTVGVVIRDADGTVRTIVSPHTPSIDCIGSEQRRASFLLARKLLCNVSDFDALPAVFGPQMMLSGPLDIPATDLDAFVSKLVFGQKKSRTEPANKEPRARERRSYGRNYLRSHGISTRHVRANFRPEGMTLAPLVTHWIAGDGRPAALLEPLSALRGKAVEQDLQDVAQRFRAYRDIYSTNRPPMIAYMLDGLRRQGVWSNMLDELADVAELVDTTKRFEERHFLGRLRDLAGIEFPLV